MSIFGLLGKVAKAGLSSVTGGVSDKILAGIKSSGVMSALKKKSQGGLLTLQDQTKVFKVGQKDGSGNAWGTTQGPGSPAAAKMRQVTASDYTPRVVDTTKRRKAKKAKAARVSNGTGTGRKPPKGGLDLKAMARAWTAAGKPGKWINWVKSKSNQIRKG